MADKPKPQPRDVALNTRMTPGEREAWDAYAKSMGAKPCPLARETLVVVAEIHGFTVPPDQRGAE